MAGEYQGGIVTFGGGYEMGVHRIRMDDQGHIYVGGLGHTDPIMEHNQGWNHTTFGLQKLIPNTAETFEILAAHSRKDGIEIEFTMPVADDATTLSKYLVDHWHYEPTMLTDDDYGGPKKAQVPLTPSSAQISPDGKSVFLKLPGMNTGTVVKGFKTGKVVHVVVGALKSKSGKDLLYNETWNTLNNISPTEPFTATTSLDGNASQGTLARLQFEKAPDGLRVLLPMSVPYRVQLLDLHGRVVASKAGARDRITLTEARHRSGVHFLKLANGGREWIKRIVF